MVLLASLAAIWLLHAEFLPAALKTAVKQYEVWVWLAFLLALSLLATYLIEWIWKTITRRQEQRASARKLLGRLHDLTVEERHVLQPFFEKNARTTPGRSDDRVVASLLADGILVQITQFGFRISEEAWQHLRKNLNLVATPNDLRPPLTGYEWTGK